jgi:hypothetical protein
VLYVSFFDVGRVGRDIGLIEDPTLNEEPPADADAPKP